MSAPMRTLVIAGDEARIVNILDRMEEIYVTGWRRDGKNAAEEIIRTAPDLLVLEGVLQGGDGLDILRQVGSRMAAPPRVLYLNPMDASVGAAALSLGADECLNGPWDEQKVLDAVKELCRLPMPGLARETEERRLLLAGELLDEMAAPRRLKGWQYICFGAACCAASPWLMGDWGRRVYPLIAGRFGASPGAVERAIRTAVESTWLSGNLQGIQRLFGFSVDAERGKPTNAEFMAMLAAHISRLMQAEMKKNDG